MRQRRRSENGATLVEAAMTLPLLLLLLGGIFDFGRAYHKKQVITNAAREAARFAVAPSFSGANTACGAVTVGQRPTSSQIQCFVQNQASAAGVTIPTSNITVSQNTTMSINGLNVVYTKINVKAPVTFIWLAFASTNVSTEVSMRNEDN